MKKSADIKTELDTIIKNNCNEIKKGEDIFIVRLIFGKHWYTDFFNLDYTYSWNGDRWIAVTKEFYQANEGHRTTIKDYEEGFKRIEKDAKTYLNSLDKIQLECKNNGKESKFDYVSNLAQTLKDRIKNKDICDYEGPEKIAPKEDIINLNSKIDNDFGKIIEEASKKFEVDKDLIKAIITQESKGNQFLIDGEETKCGKIGLMQILPLTAKQQVIDFRRQKGGLVSDEEENLFVKKLFPESIGFPIKDNCDKGNYDLLKSYVDTKTQEKLMELDDRFDPQKNIFTGTFYFKSLINQFNSDQKLELAIAAYNLGPEKVKTICSTDPTTCPNWAYVNSILTNLNLIKSASTS